MQVTEQGEEYIEESAEEIMEEYADGDTEEQLNQGVKRILGIDAKLLVIILAVLFVIILLAVMIVAGSSKKDSNAEIVDPSGITDPAQLFEDSTLPAADTTVVAQTPAPVVEDSATEETMIVGDDVYIMDATGEWVLRGEPVSSVTVDDIGDDTTRKLRGLGYTADEIEFARNNGFDVQALIDAAEQLRDEEAKAALHRMSSDALSPEFQYLLKATYMGQPGHDFISYDGAEFGTYDYSTVSVTINADFEKCPVYGLQLQLKCRIADDQYVWYQIDPTRFAQLPNSGNIVLQIDYVIYGEYFYVVGVRETNSTLSTVDASSEQNPLQHVGANATIPDAPEETEVTETTEVTTEEATVQ